YPVTCTRERALAERHVIRECRDRTASQGNAAVTPAHAVVTDGNRPVVLGPAGAPDRYRAIAVSRRLEPDRHRSGNRTLARGVASAGIGFRPDRRGVVTPAGGFVASREPFQTIRPGVLAHRNGTITNRKGVEANCNRAVTVTYSLVANGNAVVCTWRRPCIGSDHHRTGSHHDRVVADGNAIDPELGRVIAHRDAASGRRIGLGTVLVGDGVSPCGRDIGTGPDGNAVVAGR